MARWCPRCMRPKDAEHHDVVQVVAGFENGEAVYEDAPKGWPHRWACRVRLIARSTTTGKVLTPTHPQRHKKFGLAAYVHVDRLKKGLV